MSRCTPNFILGSNYKGDKDLIISYMLGLCRYAPYYNTERFSDIINYDLKPPLLHEQWLMMFQDGKPIGMATWAMLAQDRLDNIFSTMRPLALDDWASGPYVYCNDYIALTNVKNMITYMRTEVFPTTIGYARKINKNLVPFRISKWRGIDALQQSV